MKSWKRSKKITESLHEEIQREVGQIVTATFRDKKKTGHFDLESTEISIRASMHNIGSKMLETLLNSDDGDYKGRGIPCEKGHKYEFKEYREKKVETVLGPVRVKRSYYYDKDCKHGYCPKDKDLDIESTSFSPGVRRIMSRVGAYRPFALGSEDIKEMAGIVIDTKEVERTSNQSGKQVDRFFEDEASSALSVKNVIPIKKVPAMYICMDGTGVPVVKAETVNRHGKRKDGKSKTREVKLGCVFTQTTFDERGSPVRDELSTTYVGAIETAKEFSDRIYPEAVRRGIEMAGKVCVIGDGAPWIWNIADEQFYGAVQIIDLYHAREHYWKAAKTSFGNDENMINQWTSKRRIELDMGKVDQVIKAIRELPASTEAKKELLKKEINYFDKNRNRMKYADFRSQGLFVGSGVLEAGCRAVIGQRLKQSGMHWTVKGANNIIALRCAFFSNRWEDFWESRASA